MGNVGIALIITVIGMGVIFVVLAILLGTIVLLNRMFPYIQAPVEPAVTGNDSETVAVVTAAVTAFLKRKPGKVTIKRSQ